MEIELQKIKIRDIVDGYIDNGEIGVVGYGGNLNIRPPYQREFVYEDKQRDAVIDTILKGYPLNVMYWAKNEDGTYEVLDGQQRTLSFCKYVKELKFSVRDNNGTPRKFDNLTDEEQKKILDYELYIYICDGNDKERLEWFTIINIAGTQLTEQELLNINYTGTWLSDAKLHFSKENCPAINRMCHTQGDTKTKLVDKKAIRQEILELALTWFVGDKKKIADYMAEHQHDVNANELWFHFCKIMDWVKTTFPKYRKEMKGIDWGKLYREYGNEFYDANELERQISALMADEEVTSKKGVYEYVLSRGKNERVLSVRAFTDKDKRTAYERQNGICPICEKKHPIENMDGDHILEWSKGGRTTIDNLQMVCKSCHKELTKRM